MEYAKKNSSLNWFDYLWCRALKNFKGENYLSLESSDMAYLLKLNEYIDVEEYISDVDERDKGATEANKPKRTGRRG